MNNRANTLLKKQKPILAIPLTTEFPELIGFSLNQWLVEHPFNPNVVSEIATEITKYVRGTYPPKSQANFSEWYVGISNDPDGARTASHKKSKNLIRLLHYKKFYAYSMTNARRIEMMLCEKWGLGHCSVAGGIRGTSKWVYVYHYAKSPRAKLATR